MRPYYDENQELALPWLMTRSFANTDHDQPASRDLVHTHTPLISFLKFLFPMT